jgi:hypothetical protein
MSPKIPTPELIGETVNGAIYELPRGTVLVVGETPDSLANYKTVVAGLLMVRYALPLLEPASEAVIPGLFAAEKGGMLVGREAWDYIQRQFQLHPRADVIGLGIDGSPKEVFLRQIDFGAPVRVLVYNRLDATTPVAEVETLVIGKASPELPELLSKYLPVGDLDTFLASNDSGR